MDRFTIFTSLALALLLSVRTQSLSIVSASGPRQPDASAKVAGSAVNLPANTLIFAKFVAELNTSQCKPGDRVEAEITHEVKVGHDIVLMRGGHVIGQVSRAAGPDANGVYGVWLIFGNVSSKDGDPSTVHLEIQAVSPPERQEDADNPGPAVADDRYATEGRHGELTARSRGAINLPNLNLSSGTSNGTHITILTSKKGNIRLAKGSQVVFRVV
jgi:hypothetical protein